MAAGSVDPAKLDAETVPFDEAENAYEALASGERRALSITFRYADEASDPAVQRAARSVSLSGSRAAKRGQPGVAFIGAGNYAKGVLLPALRAEGGVRCLGIAATTGPSALRTAERFAFERCTTDADELMADPEVDLVFVATRHDSHAELAVRALRAGKCVWLEKPVGLRPDEVEAVLEAERESAGWLMVGYNRRFSSHARQLREAFAERQGPLSIHYAVAAGAPPAGTWITDPAVGGGRIVGELCHFVDLCRYVVGGPVRRVSAHGLGRDPEVDDSVVTLLAFEDGSAATIEYLAYASPELPKERIELSADGRTAR